VPALLSAVPSEIYVIAALRI